MYDIGADGVISIQVLKEADNESLNGAGVDMLGYESVIFIAGALKGEAADFTIKAQQDTDAAFGTAADLAGTGETFSTTVEADALAILSVHQPQERYVRPAIGVPDLVAAKSVFCVAIQYNAKYKPITQSGEFEHHVSPAEGTA